MSRLVAAMVMLVALGCSAPDPRLVTQMNRDARLAGDLPVDLLREKVITLGAYSSDSTIFVLFGNDKALQHSRTSAEKDYPVGSVVTLVTWKQQEDPRWFGARIPESPKIVEMITRKASNASHMYAYRRFEGSPLAERATSDTQTQSRIDELLAYRPAVMP